MLLTVSLSIAAVLKLNLFLFTTKLQIFCNVSFEYFFLINLFISTPLIFLLPHFFGLSGVEMCQAWADVCAFLLSLPVALSGFRDMRMQRVDNQLLK